MNADLSVADDSAILALFHEWQGALAAANSAARDEEAEPLDERVWTIERQIHDTAAAGASGMAVKAYILARAHVHTNTNGLFLPFTENDYGAGGCLCLTEHAVKGLVADAARFLPELAPVVVGVVTSPTKLPEPVGGEDRSNVVAFPKRRAREARS